MYRQNYKNRPNAYDSNHIAKKPHWYMWSIVINSLIAVFTLALVMVSFCNIKAANETIDIQKEYYQTITRPFVNIANIDSLIHNKDFSFSIYYSIENHGPVPAKELQSGCLLKEDELKIYKKTYDKDDVSYAVYPNEIQSKTSNNVTVQRDGYGGTVFEPFDKDLFLHIAVIYKGLD